MFTSFNIITSLKKMCKRFFSKQEPYILLLKDKLNKSAVKTDGTTDSLRLPPMLTFTSTYSLYKTELLNSSVKSVCR